MTKAELTRKISNETGLEQAAVSAVLESAMSNIKQSLAGNDAVYLRGFGTFKATVRKAKTARNIKANTTITVPEHAIPDFKPCNDFKEAVKDAVKKV